MNIEKDKILKLLCQRIALFEGSVSEVDYPRLEELAYLLSAILRYEDSYFLKK